MAHRHQPNNSEYRHNPWTHDTDRAEQDRNEAGLLRQWPGATDLSSPEAAAASAWQAQQAAEQAEFVAEVERPVVDDLADVEVEGRWQDDPIRRDQEAVRTAIIEDLRSRGGRY